MSTVPTGSLEEVEDALNKFSMPCTDELEQVLKKRQYVLQVRDLEMSSFGFFFFYFF